MVLGFGCLRIVSRLDPAALDQIERIVHPPWRTVKVSSYAHDQGAPLVFDNSALFETKADGWLSLVLAVSVPGYPEGAGCVATWHDGRAVSGHCRGNCRTMKRRRADHVCYRNVDWTKTAAVRKLTAV
jgi:hypothetical protein